MPHRIVFNFALMLQIHQKVYLFFCEMSKFNIHDFRAVGLAGGRGVRWDLLEEFCVR